MAEETPKTPPAAPPVGTADTIPAPPPSAAAPPAAAPAAPEPPAPKKVVALSGDEDELPEGADKFELTRAALASRNTRASRKFLKDNFGTDDPGEVKKKLDRLEALEKQEEETRRASMSREQQLEEDLKKERAKAEHWRSKHKAEIEERAMTQSEAMVRDVAAKHLKPKFIGDDVYRKLGRHLAKGYSRRDLERLESEGKINGVIDEWFGKYAEENPELALGYEDRILGGAKPPPVARPLNNGARPGERPEPPAGPRQEKSFAPTGPNAMTPQEARAAARDMGLNWD
jgi:hypothetical protein